MGPNGKPALRDVTAWAGDLSTSDAAEKTCGLLLTGAARLNMFEFCQQEPLYIYTDAYCLFHTGELPCEIVLGSSGYRYIILFKVVQLYTHHIRLGVRRPRRRAEYTFAPGQRRRLLHLITAQDVGGIDAIDTSK